MEKTKKLNDNELEKTSGGKQIDYIPIYSFDAWDTFKNTVTYYVVTNGITRVPAGTWVECDTYVKVLNTFLFVKHTTALSEVLGEDYEDLGNGFITTSAHD